MDSDNCAACGRLMRPSREGAICRDCGSPNLRICAVARCTRRAAPGRYICAAHYDERPGRVVGIRAYERTWLRRTP